MRTTLTIGDDVYRSARNLAALRGIGIGEAVTELARRGLAREALAKTDAGLPSFQVAENAPRFGLEDVARADDEE